MNGQNFLFGVSETVPTEFLPLLVKKILLTGSSLSSAQELCDVVLVGHDMQPNIKLLLRNKICNKGLMKNLYLLDTYHLGIEVFDEHFDLKDPLKKLQIPFTALKCGGNDASFTLKALLLLSICNSDTITMKQEERATHLITMAKELFNVIYRRFLTLLRETDGSKNIRARSLADNFIIETFCNSYDASRVRKDDMHVPEPNRQRDENSD
jgi:hypothetical protein